jgi:hypothetical protein
MSELAPTVLEMPEATAPDSGTAFDHAQHYDALERAGKVENSPICRHRPL